MVSGAHHTYRRAGEICPCKVIASNLPKFSFIKTALEPGGQLLSALPEGGSVTQRPRPHLTTASPSAGFSPSVTRVSPPLDTSSSWVSDKCSRDMRHQEHWEVAVDRRPWRPQRQEQKPEPQARASLERDGRRRTDRQSGRHSGKEQRQEVRE